MGFSAPAELGMGAVRTAGRSKRIDTKVSILLGLQFPLFLSLAKIRDRRPLRKCGTAVGLLLRLFRNLFAVHRYLTATHMVYSTQVLDVISRLTSCAALLSPRGPSLALRAIHLVPRLLRAASMCSRTLSDTANKSRHGSTLCSPTVEKILCRSLFRSGRRSLVCAGLSNKGKAGVQRGRETAGVPSFLPTAVGTASSPPQRRRIPR